MAHYAFLDSKNTVTSVIVGKDEGTNDIDWEKYYTNVQKQICKRTSYNTIGGVHLNGGTPFRKNYAAIGFKYDFIRDAFIPPQPFAGWILNEETCQWEAPEEEPEDYMNEENLKPNYLWDNITKTWVKVR